MNARWPMCRVWRITGRAIPPEIRSQYDRSRRTEGRRPCLRPASEATPRRANPKAGAAGYESCSRNRRFDRKAVGFTEQSSSAGGEAPLKFPDHVPKLRSSQISNRAGGVYLSSMNPNFALVRVQQL